MLIIWQRPVSVMILVVVALHLFWAAAIFVDTAALNATAVNALHRFIQPPPLLITVLIAVAALAAAGALYQLPWWSLVPQQFILLMSAAGVIEAIWQGQFADGVPRASAFIAADQIYAVLLAFGHILALVTYSRNGHLDE